MSETIDELLARIGPLKAGAHKARDAMCIMEAVAFVAREPWSDSPACASKVIGAFLRAWNDAMDDDTRDRLLRPLIQRLIGTAGDDKLENRRATIAADWLVRVHTPAWLRLAGLTAHADALSALHEITDFATCPSLMQILDAARKDAAAARAAARDAAWAAARAAAWAAARDAAWAVLKETVATLQSSALDLVNRMIDAK
jgi:hypothetical protein